MTTSTTMKDSAYAELRVTWRRDRLLGMWRAGRNPIVRHRLRTVELVVGHAAASVWVLGLQGIGIHVLPHDFALSCHLKDAPGLALTNERIAVRKAPR